MCLVVSIFCLSAYAIYCFNGYYLDISKFYLRTGTSGGVRQLVLLNLLFGPCLKLAWVDYNNSFDGNKLI